MRGKLNRDFWKFKLSIYWKWLNFEGLRLGESRKPDGIISHDDKGVIIDNKAYSEGYELPISQADEMIRYIDENKQRDKTLNSNEWWLNFDKQVNKFHFLFVTSYLKNKFKDNLEYISNRTSINGGTINVENLLYFAEKIKSGELSYPDSFNYYQNDEIIIT